MATTITLRGVSFAFDDATILRDIHLTLEPGWYGIVGANGAGKTTLLRLLSGDLSPTEGTLRLAPPRDRATVVVCPQTDDDRDRSPGESKKRTIETALAKRPDVLLLDEPTNHLDAVARAAIVGLLRRHRGVGVVVTHDRALLDALEARILRVHHATVSLHPPGYDEARRAWDGARAAEEEAHRAARSHVKALEARLDGARRTRASAEKQKNAKHRMKSVRDHDAKSMGAKVVAGWAEATAGRHVAVLRDAAERARAEVPRLEKDRTLGGRVFATFERAPSPVLFHVDAPVIEREGVPVLHDVRLTIGRGDRVRIAGANGAGKTTLLDALLAPRAELVASGRVLYLPQELDAAAVEGLVRELGDLDDRARGRTLAVVGALGSDAERFVRRRSDGASLSPGEARKLALALALGRHAWALVLDEPTNHMDLPTVERLERALAEYPGAIVLVTHDDAFAARVTTQTIMVAEGLVR